MQFWELNWKMGSKFFFGENKKVGPNKPLKMKILFLLV